MRADLIVGGLAVLAVAVVYLLKSTTGRAVGEQIGGAVVGLADSVVVAPLSNPDVNPLHGVGTWIGGTIYDILN